MDILRHKDTIDELVMNGDEIMTSSTEEEKVTLKVHWWGRQSHVICLVLEHVWAAFICSDYRPMFEWWNCEWGKDDFFKVTVYYFLWHKGFGLFLEEAGHAADPVRGDQPDERRAVPTAGTGSVSSQPILRDLRGALAMAWRDPGVDFPVAHPCHWAWAFEATAGRTSGKWLGRSAHSEWYIPKRNGLQLVKSQAEICIKKNSISPILRDLSSVNPCAVLSFIVFHQVMRPIILTEPAVACSSKRKWVSLG